VNGPFSKALRARSLRVCPGDTFSERQQVLRAAG